ncbi:RNA polymerase sigma factor [Mangrovibacterium diazotrophicum]|uniref:RNA polymerase sigma factor (Sigma-70 family) n=1 Tax=Mangrovibacterium diazotrophicum TaxID=1261403 RepID=A0A419W688_9BACT|nr:sigma-70 family RNA polymerase sigma factor [Mangrovibacterium diazotrophicum]RKD90965.1 RNA polymerase sigma factor (sigma-70 family) [Mangrovibacterium diazotrophicum]
MSISSHNVHRVENTSDYTWQAFLRGDQDAFTQIYHQYAENLFRFGRKFSVDEQLLDDAVQEVFVDLYLKREKLAGNIKNIKAYLFVALKNNLLKKLDKSRRIPTLGLDNFRELNFEIEYDAQQNMINFEIEEETNVRLTQAINQLSKKQKEIIYLKFEEELDYPEIAEVLLISVESARKQIYRALKSLRESLDSEEFTTLLYIFVKKS